MLTACKVVDFNNYNNVRYSVLMLTACKVVDFN